MEAGGCSLMVSGTVTPKHNYPMDADLMEALRVVITICDKYYKHTEDDIRNFGPFYKQGEHRFQNLETTQEIDDIFHLLEGEISAYQMQLAMAINEIRDHLSPHID